MESERKTRSTLDAQLSGAEQDAFFAYMEGGPDNGNHTLAEGQKWLYDHKLIELSQQSISVWLAKRRKEAGDLKFAALLTEIRDDAERAEHLGRELGELQVLGITQANVAMLSQALFRAQREKSPQAVEFFTNLLSTLLQAVAKSKAGEASVISAETARDRFQFDAAKRALEAAASLQRINESAGDQREKIDRARETLFGRRPNEVLTSTHAGADDDISNRPPVEPPSNINSNNEGNSEVRK